MRLIVFIERLLANRYYTLKYICGIGFQPQQCIVKSICSKTGSKISGSFESVSEQTDFATQNSGQNPPSQIYLKNIIFVLNGFLCITHCRRGCRFLG